MKMHWKRPIRRCIFVVMMAAGLAGCASAPKDAGFSEVREEVAERSGYAAAWTRGAEENAKVNEVARDLLAEELKLEEAIQIALLGNRNLQATFEELGISRAELIQAGLPENPPLSSAFRFFDAGLVVEGSFVQDLISVITIPLRRERQGNQFEATKRLVTAEVATLVAEVKRAYIDYQASKQTVELLQQVVQATKSSYMVSERLREAGNARQLEVLQERALYEEAKVALNAATEALALARERMNAVMGLWGARTVWETPPRLPEVPADAPGVAGEPGLGDPAPSDQATGMVAQGLPGQRGPGETQEEYQAERLAGGPTNEQIGGPAEDVLGQLEGLPGPGMEAEIMTESLQPAEKRFSHIERMAIKRNLELGAARHLIEAQAAQLEIDVITTIFPFLNFGGTFERDPAGPNAEWGVGPVFDAPIPVWDFGQAQYSAEASRLRQRVENYAALAVEVRATARALEARLQTARARALYHREVILPLHATLMRETQLQYNAMQVNPFQLLTIKEQQIAAGIAYVQSLQDYWMARSQLEQLLDGALPAVPGVPTPAAIGGGLGGVGGGAQPRGGIRIQGGQ